jgi:hypothetical protein
MAASSAVIALAPHQHSAVDTASFGPAGHHHHHAFAASTTHGERDGPIHGSGHATKCSVCASCCASAALLPGAVPIEQPRFASDFDPLEQATALSFLTSGQERPPRTLLA